MQTEDKTMSVTYESEKTGRVLTWKREYIDFPPHYHETVELVAVLRGSCTASVDFSEYELREGDVFVAFPNRIHSYSNERDLCCYTFLFPADICPPLAEIFASKLPAEPVIGSGGRTAELLRAFEGIYEHNRRRTFYDKQIARGYFAVLLSTVLSMLTLEDAPSSAPSTERRIIDYCMKNFRAPLTLAALSRDLYIDRYHISRFFSSKLKVRFNDFINHLRIRDACARLEDGESVTAAALGSGFSSIRTFNRAFLKDTGMNPREYLRRTRNN